MVQLYYFSFFTQVCLRKKDVNGGLDCISQALKIVEQTHEDHSLASLYHLKGLLQSMEKNIESKSENSFLTAIEIAQRQSAKWYD